MLHGGVAALAAPSVGPRERARSKARARVGEDVLRRAVHRAAHAQVRRHAEARVAHVVPLVGGWRHVVRFRLARLHPASRSCSRNRCRLAQSAAAASGLPRSSRGIAIAAACLLTAGAGGTGSRFRLALRARSGVYLGPATSFASSSAAMLRTAACTLCVHTTAAAVRIAGLASDHGEPPPTSRPRRSTACSLRPTSWGGKGGAYGEWNDAIDAGMTK